MALGLKALFDFFDEDDDGKIGREVALITIALYNLYQRLQPVMRIFQNISTFNFTGLHSGTSLIWS